MNLKNQILRTLGKKLLKRNRQFENIHKGESCYLFGNGASLKYFDLKKFDDRPVIGCGALFLHRDFRKINVKYYYEGHPLFYYPLWVNPYSKKIKSNPMGAFYKGKKLLNHKTLFFCNMSNYFGIRGNNIYYTYHFGTPFNGFADCRLDGEFTAMSSSLAGMLGLALFMGFEDITLVGCDYSFLPRSQGHFYEFGRFPDSDYIDSLYDEFLLDAMTRANIRTMTPNGNYKGRILPHIEYNDITGLEPVYQENDEIVSNDDLLMLDRLGMLYKIFP